MYTIANSPAVSSLNERSIVRNPSVITRFVEWTENQSEARFIWLGIALLAHASFLTPFTAMAVMLNGNNFTLLMATLGAMGLSLVTNLAALPTKVTIPAFFLSILIDIVIVVVALS